MVTKEVTKQEKLDLVASRIRNHKINKFNSELFIIEEEASLDPTESDIASARASILSSESQIAALEEKYSVIQAE